MNALVATARTLVASGKGLQTMDESNPTRNKRFAAAGIPQTEETRRAYRELIVTTPGLGECISGAILYDETIRQRKKDGTSFVKVLIDAGILPGIKLDIGAKDLAGHPGEKVTRSPKLRMPWSLVFSFARAIQQPALEVWRGQKANVLKAQRALRHRAECNRAAPHGDYHTDRETV